MNRGACRSELVLAERRGSLNVSERDALHEHLRDCDHCRILRDFGRAFDEPESIRADDAERLDGMFDAASRWLGAPRKLRRVSNRNHRYKTLWLAAAITVSASAAAAAIAVNSTTFLRRPTANDLRQRSGFTSVFSTSTPTRNPSAARLNTTASAPALQREPPPLSPIDKSAEEPAEFNARKSDKKVAKTTENAVRVEVSAEQLLQQANEARRSQNVAQASRLFRELQRLYPTSREARLSEVVFGTLLLEQGQAAAALGQLNRYLASGSGQNLAAEAFYGKGRALAQLGRMPEEQAVWRTLLERFPKSPYASHARKRLGVSP